MEEENSSSSEPPSFSYYSSDESSSVYASYELFKTESISLYFPVEYSLLNFESIKEYSLSDLDNAPRDPRKPLS